MKKWSPYGNVCGDCDRADRPHKGRGLCRACYERRRRSDTLPDVKPRWSPYSDACVACGSSEQKHCARLEISALMSTKDMKIGICLIR